MSVFVTRRIAQRGLEVLEQAGLSVEIGQSDDALPLSHAALLEGVMRHPIVLCHLTDRIDRALLEAAPHLRGISQMAVGFDNIDVTAALERGVPVAHTPGVLTEATADLTFALLLATARRVVEADAFTRAGRFVAFGPSLLCGAAVGPSPDGQRKTLGIVGFGRIGAAVAKRARGFDMDLLAYSRSGRVAPETGVVATDLDELCARSDFVSIHVPMSPATHHLFDRARIARMKPGAILINTARGPIVDESALVDALVRGHLGGAGLDVYEDEPRLHEGLAPLSNVVLLPHIGSATVETRTHMAIMAAQNAVALARGERPRWLVPGSA
jgi:glyoxylate reductase